jgi:beta-phosphoglucomutase
MSTLAVIFDMDGVLIDSYDAHFAGWSRMYRELEMDYTEEDFAADFGRTSRDILFRRFGDKLADARIRELDDRKEALFRDSLREHFTAMDGARELIDALAADDFRIAVGSSAPPENIELCLEKLGHRGAIGAESRIRKCFKWQPPASESSPATARSLRTRCMESKPRTALK